MTEREEEYEKLLRIPAHLRTYAENQRVAKIEHAKHALNQFWAKHVAAPASTQPVKNSPDKPTISPDNAPEWESNIIEAIRTSKRPLESGEDVARAVGCPYNANFKAHMADLMRRKRIAKVGGKYIWS